MFLRCLEGLPNPIQTLWTRLVPVHKLVTKIREVRDEWNEWAGLLRSSIGSVTRVTKLVILQTCFLREC